jgi:hypothetical protein
MKDVLDHIDGMGLDAEKADALKELVKTGTATLNDEAKVNRLAAEGKSTEIEGLKTSMSALEGNIKAIAEAVGKGDLEASNPLDAATLANDFKAMNDRLAGLETDKVNLATEASSAKLNSKMLSALGDKVYEDAKGDIVELLSTRFGENSEGKFVDKNGKGIDEVVESYLEGKDHLKQNKTKAGAGVSLPKGNFNGSMREAKNPVDRVNAAIKQTFNR